jgi:staphylococcal nuclease domain-containing protein 1
LARASKQASVNLLMARMVDSNSLVQLAADLKVAEETARKSRSGMWRYGDVGDEDPDEL